jgi:hypothetical protein
MTLSDKAARVDRATRQAVLDEARYQCQLGYGDCTVTATEITDVGGQLKAACQPCRQRRETNRSHGNRMAGNAIRRSRT